MLNLKIVLVGVVVIRFIQARKRIIENLSIIMKIIIAGGRDFDDYEMLCRRVDNILSRQTEIEIVSGRAKGADQLGERYAKERGYIIKMFPADWNTYRKAAGYIRNTEMAEYADALIVFWNYRSKGTEHMINIAREENLLIRIIKY